MSTGFVWDERFAWHQQGAIPLGPSAEPYPGPDTPETKRRIYSLVQVSGLGADLTTLSPRMATEGELCRLHYAAYVERVQALSAADGGSVGESVSIGAGGFEIAALAAGGCLVAVDAVLEGRVDNAYALVRPAGHHAEVGRGRGFCVFGNTALAALHAKEGHGVGRLAIIDWDVHHGNGTEDAFYDNADVLTLSIHQDGNYPEGRGGLEDRGEGAGLGANINVPLPPGSGHGAYIKTVDDVVLPALARFRPEVIMIASGVDASARDPMGRMLCSAETFRTMTERLMAVAGDLADGRLVACHEGGYAPTHAPFCTLAIIETLAERRTAVVDPMAERLARSPGHALQPAEEEVIRRAAELAASVPPELSRAKDGGNVTKNDLGHVDMFGAKPIPGLRGFLAALVLLCSAAAAGAVELEIGKTYKGGERIEAKAYGLSFTVPKGWSGLLPPGGTFFAMTPDNRTFVFATAEPGSAQDAQGSLSQPLPLGNGIKLQPIGGPRIEGDGFAIDYSVLGASEPHGSEGRALVGDGVIAGFIGVAPKGSVEMMRAALAEIAAGAGFDDP